MAPHAVTRGGMDRFRTYGPLALSLAALAFALVGSGSRAGEAQPATRVRPAGTGQVMWNIDSRYAAGTPEGQTRVVVGKVPRTYRLSNLGPDPVEIINGEPNSADPRLAVLAVGASCDVTAGTISLGIPGATPGTPGRSARGTYELVGE